MKHVFKLHWFTRIGLLALLAVVLQGCGGGGGGVTPPPPPPPDANPTGYYGNNGTATVKEDNNVTDINITDLQAMVHNNRLMMMSATETFLYDITITSISGNSFNGTAVIYINGQNPANATVSGTITQGSSITGTLTGTGAGNGTFSLTYATINNLASEISRIESTSDTWKNDIGGGIDDYEFTVDSIGVLDHDLHTAFGYFASCRMNGTVTALTNSSLYSVSVTITNCSDGNIDGAYTGLATSQNNVDTILVLALTNGDFSVSADFYQ